ncbi:MAG TPA: recombinase family protein [Bryobacteraceae bacterium]|nr:recombinase family protein [Bryobacteraceae bacterium]
MVQKQRLREPVGLSPTLEQLAGRVSAGWRLVALEWERDAEEDTPEPQQGWGEEIPYGLQISEDGARLVENPAESEIIVLALDMIVEDCPLSKVAEELNRRGCRTRDGGAWTPGALFDLLPRMIQVGPRLFTSEKWLLRRERLPRVGAEE